MGKKKKLLNGKKIEIWTDGGCVPNPGHGAWACVLVDADSRQELHGEEQETTNNRMEMLAAIMGLEALTEPTRVVIYSDSQWFLNCASHDWRRHKNLDLWERFDKAEKPHSVGFQWVRGHAGTELNERCHALVSQYIGEN